MRITNLILCLSLLVLVSSCVREAESNSLNAPAIDPSKEDSSPPNGSVVDYSKAALVATVAVNDGDKIASAISANGQLVAYVGKSGRINIIDRETEVLQRTIEVELEFMNRIKNLVFSTNGKTILAQEGKNLQCWRTEDGKSLYRISAGGDRFTDFQAAPKKDLFAVSHVSGLVDIRHVSSGEILRSIKTKRGKIYQLAICPDGLCLAVAQKNISIWDVKTGKLISVLPQKTKRAGCLKFSPQGSHLACWASYQVGLKIWDVSSGQLKQSISCSTQDAVFSPDGESIVTACIDLQVWGVESGVLLAQHEGHQAAICDLSISNDGKNLIASSKLSNIHIWKMGHDDANPLNEISPTILRQKHMIMSSIVFSGDGKTIYAAGKSPGIYSWNIETSKKYPVLWFGHGGHQGVIADLAYCQSTSTLASAGVGVSILADRTIIWAADGSTVVIRVENAVHSCVAFATDGSTLAIGCFGGGIRVRGLTDASIDYFFQTQSSYKFRSIEFLPDGKSVLVTTNKGYLKQLSIKDGKVLNSFIGHTGIVHSAKITPDGKTVISGCEDGSVRLWDAKTGKQTKILLESDKPVLSVAVNHDGTMVAACGEDRTARIWDINTGELQHSFRSPVFPITDVTFSPNGKILATTDGWKVRLWPIE